MRPYRLDDAEARWQAIEESRDHLRRYEPEQATSCCSVAESQVWIIQANADWLVRKRFAIGFWTQVTNRYLGGIGLRPREGDGWSVPAFELGYWVRASASPLPQELAKLDRYACLILDDIGYVQHDQDEMEILFTDTCF